LIHGKCHCGNISFSLSWDPDPAEIPARACSCTFCVKHGGVWTSNPAGALRVFIGDPALVSRYAFGTRTAEFHACARCGVVPVATSRIDNQLYAVVSVNAFEGVDPSLLRRASTSFDGEGTETRLQRRTRNWIADVRFLEPGFRPATEADMPFLVDLRRRTMTAHQLASGVHYSEPEQLERVLARFECAQIVLLSREPAGLLKVARDGTRWQLLQIQVAPERQDAGLGGWLVQTVIADARRAGASLRLRVLRANPARRLYERLGFRIAKEEPHAYEMHLDPA
jgi:ribosomal protein S18 acetylase RimI-like enzyme